MSKRLNLLQQDERVDARPLGQPFQTLEREVALASLDAAHVGAMHPEEISEGFLAQAACFAVEAQIATNSVLQVAFHATDGRVLLLDGLQTDE